MADSHLEREQKLAVDGDYELPELPGARVRTLDLRATYYDTEDASLQASGVTLRRRVGGSDDGWHVKIPHPDGKLELQVDVTPTRPPKELTALTRGLRLAQPLHRTAVIRTQRRAHRLHDPGGELVAEIADDQVAATVESTGEVVRWRELEVELGPAGTQEDMDRLTEQLTAAGAAPSSIDSKYAHAVGDRPVLALTGLMGLVDDYLQTQLDRLVRGDLRMRRGENRVHKTRVAVRRTRSLLKIFSALFDEAGSAHLDGELKWYGDALGAVRDLDVFGRQLEQDLADEHPREPTSLITSRGADALVRAVESRRDAAWKHVLSTLDGKRYGDLLSELASWRRQAPWTQAADADAAEVAGYVERARKKADKRLKEAESAPSDEADESFHRARKAAKRTRYAAELAGPQLGKPARRIAKAHEQRQDDLGVVQDHRMLTSILRDIAGRRSTTSEVGFICGVLAERHLEAKERLRGQ